MMQHTLAQLLFGQDSILSICHCGQLIKIHKLDLIYKGNKKESRNQKE